MIQFNLLPEVKVTYIKARRTKRIVMIGAVGTIVASVVVLLILSLVVFVWQNLRIKNFDKSIKSLSFQIEGKPDIDKVLTIQNQLASIDTLHSEKPEAGRLFTYITQVTPSDVTIESYVVDFNTDAHTMTIGGQAPSLEAVNKLVDTLKFTTISKSADDKEELKAFSQVVLDTFKIDSDQVNYIVKLNYDNSIFASAEKDIKLVVPKITTTRSSTERPSLLFQESKD